MTDELPPAGETGADSAGFDLAFRGYDRRQVEDYVERVEIALSDADRQHQQAVERLTAVELELAALRLELGDAERKAAGLPEPSSRVGERLLEMLRLAEQEAEEIVQIGHQRAAANTADLQASLERREAQVVETTAAAEQARLDAQQDADAVRGKAQADAEELMARTHAEAEALWAKAQADADELWGKAQHDSEAVLAKAEREARDLEADARRQADAIVAAASAEAERTYRATEQDAAALQADAREHTARMLEEARHQVEELERQRQGIAAQLEALKESVRTTTDEAPPLRPRDDWPGA